MKSKGIVRNIDELGRIVIPKEMRKMIGVSNSDPVEITCDGEAIAIKKYSEVCILCSESGELYEVNGKKLCRDCIQKIKVSF